MRQLTLREICELENSEHRRHYYTALIGKMIYPCAINPLDEDSYKNYVRLVFNSKISLKGRYEMIRWGKIK